MIEFKGLKSGDAQDERTTFYLNVSIDGDTYPWFVKVAEGTDPATYLTANEDSILDAVQAKIDEWEETQPTTDDGDGNEIPVSKADFVKPDYPDYFVKRKRAYPSLGEQLDAVWKGGQAQEDMADLIASIKAQYPKP